MDIESELSDIFSERSAGPFLFLGSGFSRRYINLEDWEGLLEKYCLTGRPYSYFKSSSNKNIPLSAALLAREFHDLWWSAVEFNESRELYANKLTDITSPLRFEICNYLLQKSKTEPTEENLIEEIQALKECDVDGIITTNWDVFTENLFPGYKVFTGQKELLFSNTLNIGEIYKIHGCCTNPDSLVLTDTDYEDYNKRNAYLASKLITIFVEHPVVFIGYSITDENIRELLKSISLCIGPENIEKLRDNLIFIDRKEPSTGPTIETSYLQFDSIQIPVKVVKTQTFTPVYEAISQFERKLPARVLRFCKERVYEIVQGQNPDKKIAVIDYDKVNEKDDIEVVFGIGVMNKLGQTGYRGIKLDEIFEDLILENKDFDAASLLKVTIASLPPRTKHVPVFKYLNSLGINSIEEAAKMGVERFANKSVADFLSSYDSIPKKYSDTKFIDFLEKASMPEVALLCPLFEDAEADALKEYLQKNFHEITASKYKYHLRKTMAFYDWKKFGF